MAELPNEVRRRRVRNSDISASGNKPSVRQHDSGPEALVRTCCWQLRISRTGSGLWLRVLNYEGVCKQRHCCHGAGAHLPA